MAELIIQAEKIKSNIAKLNNYFNAHAIQWSLITKVFSGDPEMMSLLLTDELTEKIHSIGDSRLTSLKNIKAIQPNLRTIYIKPPAAMYADEVVAYADVSLNSSVATIQALNTAAAKAGKIHEVIIMIELGELREGILCEDILAFYETVFQLPNIRVTGIGSNLGCMYGVEPTYDKLLQLSLYKNLIALKFNKALTLLSGGTSITLPLHQQGKVPQEINHFRIGAAAFFGTSPLDGSHFLDLHTDTFRFRANIIELEEKEQVPDGIIGDANIGHTRELNQHTQAGTTWKAILDFGLIDVDQENLVIDNANAGVEFVGITSDMTVIDLGKNSSEGEKPRYKVGDQIEFIPNYMGVVRLLNSKFIDKRFE